jgi:hypothetical protein
VAALQNYTCSAEYAFTDIMCKTFQRMDVFSKGSSAAPIPNQMFITTFTEEGYTTTDKAGVTRTHYMRYVTPAIHLSKVVMVADFDLPEEFDLLQFSSKTTRPTDGGVAKLLGTNTLPIEVCTHS